MSAPQDQLIAQIRGAISKGLGLDYQGIALQLAKVAGKSPRDIATALQSALAAEPNISKVDIAGPGFINFTLNRASQAELVNVINQAGKMYGNGSSLAGKNFNVEFISANPTGPLHLGHTRWAAVGDVLARILGAAGANVTECHS
ncbi:MAG: hypothetical protein RLY80_677 [Actinomycetota bacterium]